MSNRGYPIQALRTDQGTKFASITISEMLRVNGISNARSGRAGHAQLHVGGKKNRTLTKMARTMLFHAGLPKNWWGHSIKYASTIRNKCKTSTFNNQETSYERFFNRTGELKLHKPFGCMAFIYVSLQLRNKLDETEIKYQIYPGKVDHVKV